MDVVSRLVFFRAWLYLRGTPEHTHAIFKHVCVVLCVFWNKPVLKKIRTQLIQLYLCGDGLFHIFIVNLISIN